MNCHGKGNITGNCFTGGLVGFNDGYSNGGIITFCSMDGNVKGHENVGGTVGYNQNGQISDCKANVNVTGSQEVGGLLGSDKGGVKISQCYVAGNITGKGNYTGGLIGQFPSWMGDQSLIPWSMSQVKEI